MRVEKKDLCKMLHIPTVFIHKKGKKKLINNNNTNYKTYIAPIFSKRIELRGAPSTGLGKLVVKVRYKVHQQ